MKHLTKVRMHEHTFTTSVPKVLAKAIGLGTGDLLIWEKDDKGRLTCMRLDDWADKKDKRKGRRSK